MAQREVAFCEGRLIGIESIYTVIDGKQINIPEKLNELRKKSRSCELFCPCGCGANLILVAGDKNLREQHFRIKGNTAKKECTAVTEGKTSIESKIVLKCWLDDNLHAGDLESRVPICSIDNIERKYEFTFLTRTLGIAVDYCYNRANLSDDKQSILEENSKDIRIIHIVDRLNGGNDGQYPEGLMKIQVKQKYCLLLEVFDVDYNKARMSAVFYAQNNDGFWEEVVFADGLLKDYRLDDEGNTTFGERSLDDMFQNELFKFNENVRIEKQKREEEQKRREEERQKLELEEARKREETRKLYEEQERLRKEQLKHWEEEQRRLREERAEEQRKRAEEEKKRQLEEETRRLEEKKKQQEEAQKRKEDFIRNIESGFSQQQTPIRDENGTRWVKCEFCGKIDTEAEFISYGGANHVNLGTCKECHKNNPEATMIHVEVGVPQKTKADMTICPCCGNKLIERNGRNGKFIGCSGYPNCRYTRSMWNK